MAGSFQPETWQACVGRSWPELADHLAYELSLGPDAYPVEKIVYLYRSESEVLDFAPHPFTGEGPAVFILSGLPENKADETRFPDEHQEPNTAPPRARALGDHRQWWGASVEAVWRLIAAHRSGAIEIKFKDA